MGSGGLLDRCCPEVPLPVCEPEVIAGQLQNGKRGSNLWGKPRFCTGVSDFHSGVGEERPSLLAEQGADMRHLP